jgi:hypothetical protein
VQRRVKSDSDNDNDNENDRTMTSANKGKERAMSAMSAMSRIHDEFLLTEITDEKRKRRGTERIGVEVEEQQYNNRLQGEWKKQQRRRRREEEKGEERMG